MTVLGSLYRTSRHALPAIIMLGALVLPTAGSAQERQAHAEKTIARIWYLRPKDGMDQQFVRGYQRHLKWHEAAGAPWTWVAWQVISGSRFGHYVEGTFGHSWTDFDAAVRPAEDAQDNEGNVIPFLELDSRASKFLRAVPGASVEQPLELFAKMLSFTYFHVQPGREQEFEALVARELARSTSSGQRGSSRSLPHWLFRIVNGDSPSKYLLIHSMTSWADLDVSENATSLLLERSRLGHSARPDEMSCCLIVDTQTEILRLRSDLSLRR